MAFNLSLWFTCLVWHVASFIYVRQQYGEDASHRGCQDPPILSCSAWVRSWICQAIVRLNHSDLMICYNVDCGEGSRKVGMARHVTHELETLGCRKTICFAVWYCNARGFGLRGNTSQRYFCTAVWFGAKGGSVRVVMWAATDRGEIWVEGCHTTAIVAQPVSLVSYS